MRRKGHGLCFFGVMKKITLRRLGVGLYLRGNKYIYEEQSGLVWLADGEFR